MSLPNAFVTLLTTSSYLPGALVLLHSLLDLHPEPRDFKTVCLVTPETVDARTIGELRKAGWDFVIGVEGISSGPLGDEGLDLMGRPDLNLALTKLHLFRLSTLFSTLIYLDADVLPLRPISHLFTITNPHVISACPDTGWPDCFNSGVMVIRPRDSDWEGLRGLLKDGSEGGEEVGKTGNGSFDGADQGLLNEWFSTEGGGGDWNRLSFTYNVTPTAAYTYNPAYRRYGHSINAVHFIGPNKPWASLQSRPAGLSVPKNKESYDYPSLVDRWFAVYDKHVRPTAAHHPDLAQRFAVPQNTAVWNQPSASTTAPEQPADRLSLSALKAVSAFGITSMRPGQYLSLPLEGRVDLVMPKSKPQAPEPPAPSSPTTLASPPVDSAPLPQSFEQQMSQPATWDASRHAPPASGRPEMEVPMNTFYESAWDAPHQSQSSYYSSSNNTSNQYPTLPAEVKNDDWYKQFVHTVPDRNYSHAVFPWEENGQNRPSPGRVFPRGDTPPPKSTSLSTVAPDIKIRQATPEVQSPSEPSQPRSMAESMASYTNAWDSVPSIRRYVSRLTGIGLGGPNRPPPMTPGLGDLSEPSSMNFASSGRISSTHTGPDSRSEGSRDGDDEDDESEDTDDDDSGLSALGGSRYRDRRVQTDRTGQTDVQIQTTYTNSSVSPGFRNVELPPPSTFSSTSSRRGSGNPGDSSQRLTRPKTDRLSSSTSSDTITSRDQIMTPPSIQSPAGGSGNRSFTIASGGQGFNSGDRGGGGGRSGGRIWDPSTDIGLRKIDTQKVLERFMKASPGNQG